MKTMEQTLQYLYSFIPQKKGYFTGEKGILRMKYLLDFLDNPQEKLKVIHIAGTSGKGSTAYLINALLIRHGFRTGLHISPHLFDIRERFQINSLLIPKSKFVAYVNELKPFFDKVRSSRWGELTFFELTAALAFYIFCKERVDYAVIETGLGGLYDGTNIVENPEKLVLLTKIGFDHQKLLGRTLSAISYQKAGIIKKGNTVISVQQKPTVLNIFYRACENNKTSLKIIKENKNYHNITVSKSGTIFDFEYADLALERLNLRLIGEHQVENASLALSGFYELREQYSFKCNEREMRLAFSRASFHCRCELIHTRNREIVLDGAHNPQKMEAFISTLIKIFPGMTFDFVISFSEGKNQISTMTKMLRFIVLIAHSITITDFELQGGDVNHQSVPLSRIADILTTLHFAKYQIRHVYTDSAVVNTAYFDTILRYRTRPLVITGSLYLIAAIYKDLMNAIKKYE